MTMKIPGQVRDYEKSIVESKAKLERLIKGTRMIEAEISKEDVLEALKLIKVWHQIANETYWHLEKATLVHQQLLTGNSVLMKTNAQKGIEFVKAEDIMSTEELDVEPWDLYSMKIAVDIFGPGIKDQIEIH